MLAALSAAPIDRSSFQRDVVVVFEGIVLSRTILCRAMSSAKGASFAYGIPDRQPVCQSLAGEKRGKKSEVQVCGMMAFFCLVWLCAHAVILRG